MALEDVLGLERFVNKRLLHLHERADEDGKVDPHVSSVRLRVGAY